MKSEIRWLFIEIGSQSGSAVEDILPAFQGPNSKLGHAPNNMRANAHIAYNISMAQRF
jgi:hypothetical protein